MLKISSKEYYNKVLGSWLGRVAGDFVGAPVEFKPRDVVKQKYGEITYFPEPINLDYVNDDEMYEICALVALEKKGVNLTAHDIGQEWVNLLYTNNFTAEQVALKNLKAGLKPPESGTFKNVYYDAIGAQMRADIWGQISPGCPEIAKKYAEIDGCISHAGIGIEGEIFIAVMISHAFFEDNIRKIISDSLPYIPSSKESLYAEMVEKSVELFNQYPEDYPKAREMLLTYWNYIKKDVLINQELKNDKLSTFNKKRMSFLKQTISDVHVLPNIGIIILSLLYGAKNKEDPLGTSICISAMMGLDTDCNCGNIGSIVGAQLGASNVPSKWKDPLQNTFATYVKGYEKWKITELAERIAAIGREVIKNKCVNKLTIQI